jgi:hypothetical protein
MMTEEYDDGGVRPRVSKTWIRKYMTVSPDLNRNIFVVLD